MGRGYAAADFVRGKPRYDGGGIVNLMASITAACGAEPHYATLDVLAPDELAPARHLVLMVVDGLGYEFLSRAATAPELKSRLQGSMTSVFPPTTAAAVTTFLTGLAPQQHGLTGWFMFARELGCVISVLPFRTRPGELPLKKLGVSPAGVFGNRPIFEALRRECYCVSPRDIAFSAFNRAHSEGARTLAYAKLVDFFAAVENAVKASSRPSFVYAYWPRLDRLAHERGIGHPEVSAHLAQFDEAFAAFLRRMSGTESAVMLTADHGFVDIAAGGLVSLPCHPALQSSLLLPLCGEPRAAYCYLAPSQSADFQARVEAVLGARAHCIPSEQLLAEGWFGPGAPHPELRARIGQFTLVMRAGCAIVDRLPGEERSIVVGVHGGVSAAEQLVPLVLARC